MTNFKVVLGSSLKELGENPFAMCKLPAFEGTEEEIFNGQTFTKPTDTYDISENIKVIGGSLYRVVPNGLELICYAGDGDTVTVADGTVRITAFAFAGSDVKQVVFPSTLKAIGHKAFYDCDKLSVVYFASYNAPILEEEYDYSYWLSAENLPATGKYQYQDSYTGDIVYYDGLGIVPYFMWNATDTPAVIYYGANFVDYVGRVNTTLTMVKPTNGIGYDSFIYGKYFTLNVDGAAAADENTLAAIDAINAIPENVTLADKAIVEAARAAYDKIATMEQRALVTEYNKLVQAEKRIKALEDDMMSDPLPEDPADEGEPPVENAGMPIYAIVLIVVGLILAAAGVTVALIFHKKNVLAKAEEALPFTVELLTPNAEKAQQNDENGSEDA